MAYVEPERGADAPVVDFPIPQLQRPGEVAARPLLPSCLYLPSPHELPPEATRLPWAPPGTAPGVRPSSGAATPASQAGPEGSNALAGSRLAAPEDGRTPGAVPEVIVGELARWQGARVPGRLVTSAKSWLCHPGVDRSAPILPWGAPAEVKKLSPVAATAGLLAHMVRAWDSAHPEAPLASQEVVITVPASFDEVARSLTVSAARQAGLEKFTLVEEPQAAFYDFTARHRHDLARVLENIRLVLIVDVGGGTTDFTLVQAAASPAGPSLRRIAVGEHLILGGDNMDAALGRKAEERLAGAGGKLTATQWSQLVQAARLAKETLLAAEPANTRQREGEHQGSGPNAGREEKRTHHAARGSSAGGAPNAGGPDKYNLSVAVEGSRLIGKTLSTHLTRAEAEETILGGFFPACGPEARPQRGGRTALQELGLPYAQDPAITRHLAAFLRTHAAAGFAALGQPAPSGTVPGVRPASGAASREPASTLDHPGTPRRADIAAPEDGRTPGAVPEGALGQPANASTLPRPDAILLNGGVFNSPRITHRLREVVSAWWPEAPAIPLLQHSSLELAVAHGAAFYGLARRGLGQRIGGGAAHALYVGLEKAGSEKPLALCVIPRGQEEGETVELGERVFQLALGRPVRFPLFSTASERAERAGDVVPVDEAFEPLPPIHTLLKGAGEKTGNVPVHLRSTLTEIGTLELWCVANTTRERWRLEFELRGAAAEPVAAVTESMPASFAEARQWVERIFGRKPSAAPPPAGFRGAPPKDVKQLWASLEQSLGPREEWRLPVLRELWSVLLAGAARRRRSSEQERIFFQLFGYCLRPGFGYPLDEWRCEQSARLFPESVQFHQDKAVWKEFWIAWRRLAGGLSETHHQQMWESLKPHLALRIPLKAPKGMAKPKGVQPEGLDEMVRLAAGLEHLPVGEKALLGEWILARLQAAETAAGPWTWALGRLGTRAPIYASVHKTLPPDQAGAWIRLLLEPKILAVEGALFALAQLARLTGDRARDVDEASRTLVAEALKAANASPSWQRMVREVVALEAADKARALGDTLPAGLTLI